MLPILTRVLLPVDYGIIAMFNATLGIMGAFTGLSVHGAVNSRYVYRDELDYPRYVGSCLWVLLVSTSLTFVCVWLFLNPLNQFTGIPHGWLLVAVLISGCNFLIQVRLGLWLMGKMPLIYGSFQFVNSLLNMGLSLLLVLALHRGYEGRLEGQAVAAGCFALVALVSMVKAGWVTFNPSWRYIKEALAFGVPLVPHVIGGFLIAAADRFVINDKLGLEAAGIYMVAVQIGMGMDLVADSINKSYVPWLYEKLKISDPLTMKKIVRGTWCYFAVALLLAGLVALLSPNIVRFVAGPAYVAAAAALGWIALGKAFHGMYLMVTNYIFFKRQTRFLAWVTLFAGALGIACTYVLVPILGIVGAGVSFAFAVGVRFAMTWVLSHKICPMPWLSVLKLR